MGVCAQCDCVRICIASSGGETGRHVLVGDGVERVLFPANLCDMTSAHMLGVTSCISTCLFFFAARNFDSTVFDTGDKILHY